nr:potassium-transporting ATPase subunit C [Deinococcus wulumuqiensis]
MNRIAQARGMQPADVEKVIRAHLTPRQLGVLGEERVNVLAVNLSLDGQ